MARMRGLYEFLFRGLKAAGVTEITVDGTTYKIEEPEDLREPLMKIPVLAAKKILAEYGITERPGRTWFKILKIVLKYFWNKIHELAAKARRGEPIKLPTVDELVSEIKAKFKEEIEKLLGTKTSA